MLLLVWAIAKNPGLGLSQPIKRKLQSWRDLQNIFLKKTLIVGLLAGSMVHGLVGVSGSTVIEKLSIKRNERIP
jgi:hypothetical protein